MFNAHLFPSFHSQKSIFDENEGSRMLNETKRTNRLNLWRDSLVKDTDIQALFGDRVKGWKKARGIKKMSYLPTQMSKIVGIEAFFSGGKGKTDIVIPNRYKQHKIKSRHQLFYLIPRNVTITYGPYHYMGILDYRLERLHGLQTALKLAGANTHLRPTGEVNHVSVWYLEKEIFTCKITDLHHGGDGELDRLCFDAAVAFNAQARKVMLHVRHKYRFDKRKFITCPCHGNKQGPYDFNFEEDIYSDEDDADEFLGEDDYDHLFTDSYREFAGEGEHLGEAEGDLKIETVSNKSNSESESGIARISLPSHLRIKFKPRPSGNNITFPELTTVPGKNAGANSPKQRNRSRVSKIGA